MIKKHYFLLLLALVSAPSLRAQLEWEHTLGPEGSAQSAIFDDGYYAYFTDDYFLYRSDDGETWMQLPYPRLGVLACSPGKLAAIQYPDPNDAGSAYRLLVSTDHGLTWTEEGQLPPPTAASPATLEVCSHGLYVSASTENALYRSVDNGASWTTIAMPMNYCHDLWSFDDKLFAGCGFQFWRLEPNAGSWTPVPTPNWVDQDYVAGFYVNGDVIMYATQQRLWVSQNYGQSWIQHAFANSAPMFEQIGSRLYLKSDGNTLRYTNDAGSSWQVATINIPNQMIWTAKAGGKLLFSSFTRGLWYWDSAAGELRPANTGLYSGAVYDMALQDDKLWVAGSGNGPQVYDIATDAWLPGAIAPLPAARHYYRQVALSAGGKIAARTELGNQLFLSGDNGQHWDTINPTVGFGNGFISPGKVFWLGEALVMKDGLLWQSLRSTDMGQTWTSPANQPEEIVAFNNQYYGVNLSGGAEVYFTADEGLSWQATATPAAMWQALGIFVAGDRLLVPGITIDQQRVLWHSTDGVNWSVGGLGLPLADYNPMPGSVWGAGYRGGAWKVGDRYFLYLPEMGFFVSLDEGATWLAVSYEPFGVMACDGANFYLGSQNGGGVVRLPIPDRYGRLLSGTVYRDANDNGQRDAGEELLPGLTVEMRRPGNAYYGYSSTLTDEAGAYHLSSLSTTADSLRLRAFFPFPYEVNPAIQAITAADTGYDFGLHFPANITDGAVRGNHIMRPRPGFGLNIRLKYANEGTTSLSGALSVKLDPHYQFSSAEPAPAFIIGGDSLVWLIDELRLLGSQSITIRGAVDEAAPLGELLATRAWLNVQQPDNFPDNNYLVLVDTIVGSFDPNEKRVRPAEGLTAAEIEVGNPLEYTIHFQNTGTYLAERVRITDQLDTALDVSTLRLLAASHTVSRYSLSANRLLEVVFDGINLPDSLSNEPDSHGFVTFSIQRNRAYNAQRPVPNQAAIYFDFNAPIITNTVLTPLRTLVTGINGPVAGDAELLIAPNPGRHWFWVSSRGQLKGAGELLIFDPAGRLCWRQPVANLSDPVRIEQDGRWPGGIYYARLQGPGGVMTGMVAIMP